MKRKALLAFALSSVLVFSGTAQADDLKSLEGTWTIESAEADGQKVESDDLKEIVVKIAAGRYDVKIKDTMDAGTLKLDETQKPKTMDATDTEGDDVGKVVKAIYEITGDTFRVCYSLNGGERPKEFATTAGSGLLLVTYKREKKTEAAAPAAPK